MKLHVQGPAFGLPSIDAECIAATALLQSQLAPEWLLVTALDYDNRLPELQDGNNSVSGFENISRYLTDSRKASSVALNDSQIANAAATSSFLRANGQTLLDVLLYVSYENYTATRSAYTKILPWHANYIIPPKRRAAARARTDHLQISSIDVDNVHDDLSNRPRSFNAGGESTFEPETQKRASLLLPRKNTLMGLLQRPENAAIFKLHALADGFFQPLCDMLGERAFFLGLAEPTAVDCLAYGFLSQMLYAELPQNWLAKTMRARYTRLADYTDRMRVKLGMQTNVEAVVSLAQCRNAKEVDNVRKASGSTLPWTSPVYEGFVPVPHHMITDLSSNMSILGIKSTIIFRRSKRSSIWRKCFPRLVAATATSLALFGYYAFATHLLAWPHGEEIQIFGRKRLSDYGHLGAALAGISVMPT